MESVWRIRGRQGLRVASSTRTILPSEPGSTVYREDLGDSKEEIAHRGAVVARRK